MSPAATPVDLPASDDNAADVSAEQACTQALLRICNPSIERMQKILLELREGQERVQASLKGRKDDIEWFNKLDNVRNQMEKLPTYIARAQGIGKEMRSLRSRMDRAQARAQALQESAIAQQLQPSSS